MSDLPKNTWYVYRHSLPLPGPVLRSPDTLLGIELDNGIWKASFEVSGRDEPVEVKSTEVSQGVWRGETQRFNFRWAQAQHGQNTVLIGETSRKGREDERRDFF
ncbi:MAG TPA: hypothetical protein VK899_12520, partial [Gemmatimonadales bacterium]|nr:hypothetical protein [Gemmatimonadales bacterium]